VYSEDFEFGPFLPMQKFQTITVSLVCCLATGCAPHGLIDSVERRQADAENAHNALSKALTPQHLEDCAQRAVTTKTGIFGSAKYTLTGPLTPNFTMTCLAYAGTVRVEKPHAYVSAPTSLGIHRIYWCTFGIVDGKLTLLTTDAGIPKFRRSINKCPPGVFVQVY
jgi:hypothetical protein